MTSTIDRLQHPDRHLRDRRLAQPVRLRRPARDGHQGARLVQRVRGHRDDRRRDSSNSSVRVVASRPTASTPATHSATSTCAPTTSSTSPRSPRSPSPRRRSAHDGGDDFEVTGDLTIRGVTKPVTIPLEFQGCGDRPVRQLAHRLRGIGRHQPQGLGHQLERRARDRRRAGEREDHARVRDLGDQGRLTTRSVVQLSAVPTAESCTINGMADREALRAKYLRADRSGVIRPRPAPHRPDQQRRRGDHPLLSGRARLPAHRADREPRLPRLVALLLRHRQRQPARVLRLPRSDARAVRRGARRAAPRRDLRRAVAMGRDRCPAHRGRHRARGAQRACRSTSAIRTVPASNSSPTRSARCTASTSSRTTSRSGRPLRAIARRTRGRARQRRRSCRAADRGDALAGNPVRAAVVHDCAQPVTLRTRQGRMVVHHCAEYRKPTGARLH